MSIILPGGIALITGSSLRVPLADGYLTRLFFSRRRFVLHSLNRFALSYMTPQHQAWVVLPL